MTIGVVFGVFDGLHQGHRAMLTQARRHVDVLTAIIPSDDMVYRLKGKRPRYTWTERAQTLSASGLVMNVRIGDEILGEYHVLDEIHPDIIFLGYDQLDLKSDLERYQTLHAKRYTVRILPPYRPDQFKSSLLNSL